jgi:hypothetical protein
MTNAAFETEVFGGDPVAVAVFYYWMGTGEPATVKDLAAALGWSAAKVRKAIDANPGGCIKGCCWAERQVPVREGNYQTVRHWRKVDAYQPDRESLRRILKSCLDAVVERTA